MASSSDTQNAGGRTPLSSVLPPLLLGTATFNYQFVEDPSRMPYTSIVARAIELGLCGFDTSPYYGPSEELLGKALATLENPSTSPQYLPRPLNREDFFLVTKVGRIAPEEFDYSPAWVIKSIGRSLERLRSPHLDLVYCHDAEFVTPAEVLSAVKTLRTLRDEGKIRYVGVSGFPVSVLVELAEMILRETGEPLDAVLSYGHCTVQNTTLASPAIVSRFQKARVGVVLNASMLNMGLLTTRGVDNGPQAAWHLSPPPLRTACHEVSKVCQAHGDRIEGIAIQYSLNTWARVGGDAGLGTSVRIGEETRLVGPSVLGVTALSELEETVKEWKGVLDGLRSNDTEGGRRQAAVTKLVEDKLWPVLGEWKDYSWASPPEGYKPKL